MRQGACGRPDALKAALIETRAKLSGAEAMIEHLQLVIARMKASCSGPAPSAASACSIGAIFKVSNIDHYVRLPTCMLY